MFSKEDLAKFKEDRRASLTDEPKKSRSNKDKPILVKHRYLDSIIFGTEWRLFGKYKNIEIANNAIEQFKHKYPGWVVQFEITDERE